MTREIATHTNIHGADAIHAKGNLGTASVLEIRFGSRYGNDITVFLTHEDAGRIIDELIDDLLKVREAFAQ